MGHPLNVIVSGGGVCGLSSAIALGRAGHQVTVYEKYPANAESGAGIVCPANSSRILREWGLDLDAVGMMCFKRGEIRDGKTLKIIRGIDAAKDAEEDGEWLRMTTRRDLRGILLNGIEVERAKGRSIDVLYEKEITDYDTHKPAVRMKDGSWVEADLIVACDGIKSKAARQVVGFDNPAKPTGSSAFRLMIPTERLMQSQLIRETLETQKPEGTIWFAVEHPRKIFVWWTSNFGQLHVFDVLIPDNENYASTEEWLVRCKKSVMMEEFQHWHPVFNEVLAQADEDPQLWKICAREPLETLFTGKLCILGDALHAMPPNRAQGGAQSIEDAAALGVMLSDIQSKDEIQSRLNLFQSLRVPRYATAQLVSQVQQDDPKIEETSRVIYDRCRMYFEPEDQKHLENQDTMRAWLAQYNVVEEAQKALARLKQPSEEHHTGVNGHA